MSQIDLGSTNSHALSFRTGDISAIVKMLQASRDIQRVIRFGYNEEGIHMNEISADRNIAIFGTFPSVNFHEYKATGPGIICFHASALLNALGNNSQRDEVSLKYDPNSKKRKYTMNVSIKRETSSTEISYDIPLLEGEREMFQWKHNALIKYVVMVKSEVIQSFMCAVINTGGETPGSSVTISINENLVEFACKEGYPISQTRLAIITDKGRERGVSIKKKSISEGTVSKEFYVRLLSQVVKFMNINTNDSVTILMAEQKSYPIIFQINIGSLGYIRVALGPKIDEEEEKM